MSNKEKTALVPKLRFPKFRDSGNWIECTFGGLATFFNGRAYKQDELLESGKYRVLRVGNFFSNNEWYYSDLELEDNKYCEYGDLLYAWSATFGPKIWNGEKVIYHYHIWKVVNNDDVNKQFLFFLLDYETEKMKVQSANGLGLLHITKGTIENWKCYRPCFEEQQKIADCLSSLDDLITAEDKKLSALRAHKKGLMQKLFPAEGKTLPEWRFPEFRDSGEWEKKELGDIGNVVASGDLDKSLFSLTYSDEFPFPVYSNSISNEGLYGYYSIGIYPKHSITITARGTLGVAFVREHDFMGIGRLIVVKDLIGCEANFLMECWNFMAKTPEEVTSIPQLTAIAARKVTLLLPNIKEQQKIADCLSSVDELITAQIEKIEALKAHKKGLMQGLFPSIEEVRE